MEAEKKWKGEGYLKKGGEGAEKKAVGACPGKYHEKRRKVSPQFLIQIGDFASLSKRKGVER